MKAWAVEKTGDPRAQRREDRSGGARGYPAASQWQRDLVDLVRGAEEVDVTAAAVGPVVQRRLGGAAAGATDASGRGGLPRALRAGIESLSGVSMEGVQVHHNSPRPATLGAQAYTQGDEIHLGPGQEQHLPHEAWHVGQQRQGRVQATRQMKQGVPLNDDDGLEREADEMGARAANMTDVDGLVALATAPTVTDVVQRYVTNPQVPGYRFSQNDAFAVSTVDPKHIVTTKYAVSVANYELRKANALIQLQCDEQFGGDYWSVKPTINRRAVMAAAWTRMSQRQPQGDGFRSFADCFRTSATVGGVDPSSRNEPQMTLQLLTGAVPVLTPAQGRDYGATSMAARVAASFFLHALPLYDQALAALRVNTQAQGQIRTQIALFTRLAGAQKITAAHNAYKLILANAGEKARFVGQFGINGAVAPTIGTMLTQYNDPVEKDTIGGDRWNFHWAGVVMVDGADYVTLENCAVEIEDATTLEMAENNDIYRDDPNPQLRTVRNQRYTKQDMLNDRWYFKLYTSGGGGQSFHDEMLQDPHATPSAVTMGIKKV